MARTKIEPSAIQDLFAGLLGRTVNAASGKPIVLFGKDQWVVGVYEDDEHNLAGLSVSDLSVANHAGAALSMVPSGQAEEGARANTLNEELLLNYREILNVAANLFPAGGGPHVRLTNVVFARPKIDPAFVKIIRKPKSRVDVNLKIDGYGGGRVSLVATR